MASGNTLPSRIAIAIGELSAAESSAIPTTKHNTQTATKIDAITTFFTLFAFNS
jgi:hypothetical protein